MAKITFETMNERNGDGYLRAFADGVAVGVVRDCLKRGDNFHATKLNKRTFKVVGRYFATAQAAARWLAKQI